jgi:hypothetical protein
LPSPHGGRAGSGGLHASASPLPISDRAVRHANWRGHLRAAHFQAASERDHLARSPGGSGGDFLPPIRPPPLPTHLKRPIAVGGVVAAEWRSRLRRSNSSRRWRVNAAERRQRRRGSRVLEPNSPPRLVFIQVDAPLSRAPRTSNTGQPTDSGAVLRIFQPEPVNPSEKFGSSEMYGLC